MIYYETGVFRQCFDTQRRCADGKRGTGNEMRRERLAGIV